MTFGGFTGGGSRHNSQSHKQMGAPKPWRAVRKARAVERVCAERPYAHSCSSEGPGPGLAGGNIPVSTLAAPCVCPQQNPCWALHTGCSFRWCDALASGISDWACTLTCCCLSCFISWMWGSSQMCPRPVLSEPSDQGCVLSAPFL